MRRSAFGNHARGSPPLSQRFHSLPIWKETVCAPEAVVDGWKKKLQL